MFQLKSLSVYIVDSIHTQMHLNSNHDSSNDVLVFPLMYLKLLYALVDFMEGGFRTTQSGCLSFSHF